MDCHVAVFLPDGREACPLGKVLPQQSVEVLVAAALPRVVRVGEVAAYSGLFFEHLVAVELGAVVPGNCLERQPAFADEFQGCAVHRSSRAVREFGDQRQARAAFDEGEKAVPLVDSALDGWAAPGFTDTQFGCDDETGGGKWQREPSAESSSLRR